jgi:hypothetical protein
MVLPEDRGNSLITSLLGVVAALRDPGVDIDPSITALDMFVALRSSRASEAGEMISEP